MTHSVKMMCFRVLVLLVVLQTCATKNLRENYRSYAKTTSEPDEISHHHHHYLRNSTVIENSPSTSSTTTTVEPYRPKTGEILVKDSLIYSQKPGTHQLRRQLWPIMEETMHTIAHGMATGAKILKHMVRPNLLITGDPNYFRRPNKAVTIKNVYLGQPSSLLHKIQTKPYKIVKEHRPVRTTTEDYYLRFNADDDPSYSVRTRPVKPNLFADIGVSGYKHFEKTVLRDLEKKEERKVEASMAFPDKSVEQQLLHGTPFADWKPMHSYSSTIAPPTTEKPHLVSKLNTITAGLMVKPVHELVDESNTKLGPNHIESSFSKTRAKYIHRKPSKPSVVATVAPTTTTIAPPVTTTSSKSVLDIPNYPDFFIKQNKHLSNSKPRHFTKATDDASNSTDKSKTSRHEQNIVSSSEQREVYVNPESTSSVTRPPRRVNRHRAREPSSDTINLSEKTKKAFSSTSATSSRGKVKFGDRSETE